MARPAIAPQRLSLTRNGRVRYALKTPYKDGTTHVIFEPLELMAHIPVRHSSPTWRKKKKKPS